MASSAPEPPRADPRGAVERPVRDHEDGTGREADARPVVPALVGPTASGKSAAAVLLAEELGLEVVSADAMQVYRGLDIGIAKPNAEEQRRVRHHLIDVVDPDERFSVARYVELAEQAIADVLARGRVPLVVGGTGFYLRALREGVPTAPEADPARQAPLWRAVEEGRLDELVAELAAASPADAERAARNPRRVVRSLEVLRATGMPPSAFPYTEPRFRYEVFVLDPPPTELRRRIARRARRQFEAGLVDDGRARGRGEASAHGGPPGARRPPPAQDGRGGGASAAGEAAGSGAGGGTGLRAVPRVRRAPLGRGRHRSPPCRAGGSVGGLGAG